MPFSRAEMIEKLEWNNGGYGFGICTVANAFSWAMARPGPGKPDLKTIVAVSGPPDKYTDEELAAIVALSERMTAEYDKLCGFRLGANLILIDKESDGRWLRKRLTWDTGPLYSPTLADAIAVMQR